MANKKAQIKQAKKELISLRTRVWAHACKRSLTTKSGRDDIPVHHLKLAADSRNSTKGTQSSRWSLWLNGTPATPRTVITVDTAPDLAGAAKSYLVGPWEPLSRHSVSGAHIPLWKVIDGTAAEIFKAWKQVPLFAWRHWCPWEGYSPLDDIYDNPAFIQCTYPLTDYIHPQFDWQAELIEEQIDLEAKVEKVCHKALIQLLEEWQQKRNPDFANELLGSVALMKSQANSHRKQLGLSMMETDAQQEMLTRGVSLLQLHCRGKFTPAHEEEWDNLRKEIEHNLAADEEAAYLDPVISEWEPSFKTIVGLSLFLGQCTDYPDHAPPLLQLAAAISLAKLLGENPTTIDGVTYPYTVRITDSPGDRDMDIRVWDALLADLERVGMNLELLNQAAKGYGVCIYKWDHADNMASFMAQGGDSSAELEEISQLLNKGWRPEE